MKLKSKTKKQIEKIVSKAYNKTACRYVKVFNKNPNYLDVLKKIVKKIPKKSEVLDAGSGSGIPVSKFLSKRFNVTGIDISDSMIKLARKNVPKAKFIKMSMTNLNFKPETFNLICSFFALFHVKKQEIPKVLKKFHEILKNKSYLVLSFGECVKDKEEILRFLGEKTYYSATPKNKLMKMLKNLGFRIIYSKYYYFTYSKNRLEKDLFVIAKKK